MSPRYVQMTDNTAEAWLQDHIEGRVGYNNIEWYDTHDGDDLNFDPDAILDDIAFLDLFEALPR